jgi:hypothetical protein
MSSVDFRMGLKARLKVVAMVSWIAVSGAYAGAPDMGFEGSWLLTQRISLSGTDYLDGVPAQVTITAKGEKFEIERKLPGGNGTFANLASNYLRDEANTVTPDGLSRRSARIERTPGGRKFTETVHLDSLSGDSHRMIIYTWVLSEDGKTLTLIRADKNSTTGEEWTMRGSYVRKDSPVSSRVSGRRQPGDKDTS